MKYVYCSSSRCSPRNDFFFFFSSPVERTFCTAVVARRSLVEHWSRNTTGLLPLPFFSNPPWQGLRPLSIEDVRQENESSYRGREYFVRWEGRAYWHCTWLYPDLLQKKSPAKLNNFIVSQSQSLRPVVGGNKDLRLFCEQLLCRSPGGRVGVFSRARGRAEYVCIEEAKQLPCPSPRRGEERGGGVAAGLHSARPSRRG